MLTRTNCRNLPKHANGYSLLELLITLAVVSILAGISTASISPLIDKHRANQLQSRLVTSLYQARAAAISQNNLVIVCPVGSHSCGSDWQLGWMTFVDANNDRSLDADEVLLDFSQLNNNRFKLGWRASAGRNFLRYSPTGMAMEFGRFTLCHESGDLELARGMVLNRPGRVRLYRDNNGDGVVEDANGHAPECS